MSELPEVTRRVKLSEGLTKVRIALGPNDCQEFDCPGGLTAYSINDELVVVGWRKALS